MINMMSLARGGPTNAQCEARVFWWTVSCNKRGHFCPMGTLLLTRYTYLCEDHLLKALVQKEGREMRERNG